MTGINTAAAALREVWSTLALHGRELAERAADRLRSDHGHHRPHLAVPRSPIARRLLIGGGAVAAAAIVSCGVVWWQLSYGPVAIDLVTPWLTSAIEERLGGQHRIEVGGTMPERDEIGGSAPRPRGFRVRHGPGPGGASAAKG